MEEREKEEKSGQRKDRSKILNFKEERVYYFELEGSEGVVNVVINLQLLFV